MSIDTNINAYKKQISLYKTEQAKFIKDDASMLTSDDVASYKEIGAKIQALKDMIDACEEQKAEDTKTLVKDDDADISDYSGESDDATDANKGFKKMYSPNINTKPKLSKVRQKQLDSTALGQYMIAKEIEKKEGKSSALKIANKNFRGDVVKTLEASVNPSLIPQDYLAEWIDLLWSQSVVRESGAHIVDTTNGNLIAPMVTGSTTAFWVNEATQPTVSDMNVGNFHLGAHKLAGLSFLSNDFIRRTPLDAAAKLQDVMSRDVALKMDLAYLFGTGPTNGQPLGIANTANVSLLSSNVVALNNAVTAGTAGSGTGLFATVQDFLLSMETQLGSANVPVQEAVWYMTYAVKNYLRGIVTDLGTRPFEEELSRGELLGHKVYISNQIPTNINPGGISTTLFLVVPRFIWVADTLNAQFQVSYDASAVVNAVQVNSFAQDLAVYRMLVETDLAVEYPQSVVVSTLTGWIPTTYTPNAGIEFTAGIPNTATGTVSS
jgi:HK97 family phage major capsid protein